MCLRDGGKGREGEGMLKAASGTVLQQNNFSISLFFFFFSPLSQIFFLHLLPAISATQGRWGRKIFKNNDNEKLHPMNRKKRTLAGAGFLFLWGRGRVDTDADREGLLAQWHLLNRKWRKKRTVAQKRCFVSAFHVKAPRMERVPVHRRGGRWMRSVCLSVRLSIGGSASLTLLWFLPSQTNPVSKLHSATAAAFLLLHPGLSPSLIPHGPKQPVFPHQAEDKESQMHGALGSSSKVTYSRFLKAIFSVGNSSLMCGYQTVTELYCNHHLWLRLACIVCMLCGYNRLPRRRPGDTHATAALENLAQNSEADNINTPAIVSNQHTCGSSFGKQLKWGGPPPTQ